VAKRRTVDVDSIPYKEGVSAFMKQVSIEENPYATHDGNSVERYLWYMGWYDSQLKPLNDKLDEKIKLKTLAKNNKVHLNLIKDDDGDKYNDDKENDDGECAGVG
jgi:hypothetical protein